MVSRTYMYFSIFLFWVYVFIYLDIHTQYIIITSEKVVMYIKFYKVKVPITGLPVVLMKIKLKC